MGKRQSCFIVVMTTGILLAMHARAAISTSVRLAWDPSVDTNVIGYFIYYGQNPSSTDGRLDVGNVTNAIISNLEPGRTYYFFATAYIAYYVESAPSNEVAYGGPGPLTLVLEPDNQLHLSFATAALQTYDIQATTTFSNWTTIATIQSQTSSIYDFVDTNWLGSRSRFYRLLTQ